MRTPIAFFVSLMLTALSLGLSWSHVLQIRGKVPWSGPFWRAAMETLYRDYAVVGGVTEVAAILAGWWLVFVVRQRPEIVRWALASALLLTVAFAGVWVGFIVPINRVFASWTPQTLPADWAAFRDRWEMWHAVIAGLKLAAFVSLAVAVLKRT
ncbi:MAG TPA: DUF1772 domain-containing protein [Gemmatimonadales bacterium]|nr:DUF1772 domain-containing protein [Gemmatimonadales bacterium]